MSQHKRLYSKGKKDGQNKQKISSFFRSKVQRQINEKSDNSLGPGQYEVSLPFVKPIYETILKNDNTIILKFNHHRSSAFNSKSPRFLFNDQISKKMDKSYSYGQQSKSLLYSLDLNGNKLNGSSKKELGGIILISEGKNNNNEGKQKTDKIKKINLKPTRKKILSEGKNQTLSPNEQFNRQYKNYYQHHTIPVVERLHNLEPDLIQKKVLHQNRYKSSQKSSQWSKYKEQRKSFVEDSIKEYSPGPGAYKLKQPTFKNFNQRTEITSWQFNSKTIRNPFLFLQRKKEIQENIKTKNAPQFFEDKISLQGSQQANLKSRNLNKKNSKQRILDHKYTGKQKQERINQQPELNFQIKTISYKENFFN